MIIQNGYIQFKHKTGGGLDANGYPVKPAETWGAKVPCQYVPKRINLQARSAENARTETSYEVYVSMPLPVEYSEQLRLSDMADSVVGEYSVISTEELRAVQEIRLTI